MRRTDGDGTPQPTAEAIQVEDTTVLYRPENHDAWVRGTNAVCLGDWE